MRIIEIAALDNGARRNQTGTFSTVPDGWAFIPESIAIPNTFPFVNIEVDGHTVTAMTAGTVPEPEPEPEPEPTAAERISTLEAENKLLTAQVAAQSDQLDFYEDCIAEMASIVYA